MFAIVACVLGVAYIVVPRVPYLHASELPLPEPFAAAFLLRRALLVLMLLLTLNYAFSVELILGAGGVRSAYFLGAVRRMVALGVVLGLYWALGPVFLPQMDGFVEWYAIVAMGAGALVALGLLWYMVRGLNSRLLSSERGLAREPLEDHPVLCPKCGHSSLAGSRFCEQCGQEIEAEARQTKKGVATDSKVGARRALWINAQRALHIAAALALIAGGFYWAVYVAQMRDQAYRDYASRQAWAIVDMDADLWGSVDEQTCASDLLMYAKKTGKALKKIDAQTAPADPPERLSSVDRALDTCVAAYQDVVNQIVSDMEHIGEVEGRGRERVYGKAVRLAIGAAGELRRSLGLRTSPRPKGNGGQRLCLSQEIATEIARALARAHDERKRASQIAAYCVQVDANVADHRRLQDELDAIVSQLRSSQFPWQGLVGEVREAVSEREELLQRVRGLEPPVKLTELHGELAAIIRLSIEGTRAYEEYARRKVSQSGSTYPEEADAVAKWVNEPRWRAHNISRDVVKRYRAFEKTYGQARRECRVDLARVPLGINVRAGGSSAAPGVAHGPGAGTGPPSARGETATEQPAADEPASPSDGATAEAEHQ